MDNFQIRKRNSMLKIDKSKKGSIDKPIISLLKRINAIDGIYSTSSCSGRIVLLYTNNSHKKNTVSWLLSTHQKVNYREISKALKTIPKKGTILFLFESPILHIACKTQELALTLIKITRKSGFKKSYILSLTPDQCVVEMMGNLRIEMPIAFDSKIIIDEQGLKKVTNLANAKLQQSHKLLKKLESEIKKW